MGTDDVKKIVFIVQKQKKNVVQSGGVAQPEEITQSEEVTQPKEARR